MIEIGDVYNHPKRSRYNASGCDMILVVMSIDNVVSALEFMRGDKFLFGSNHVRLLDSEYLDTLDRIGNIVDLIPEAAHE